MSRGHEKCASTQPTRLFRWSWYGICGTYWEPSTSPAATLDESKWLVATDHGPCAADVHQHGKETQFKITWPKSHLLHTFTKIHQHTLF